MSSKPQKLTVISLGESSKASLQCLDLRGQQNERKLRDLLWFGSLGIGNDEDI